jgi:ribosomal protein L9
VYIIGHTGKLTGKKVIMGFLSFLKKIFGGRSKDEAELDAARARHGITVDKKEINKPTSEAERFGKDYNVWDDIRNYRSNFLVGNWVARKFRPIGEEKVKKQLEDLEKKREEERKMKEGEK